MKMSFIFNIDLPLVYHIYLHKVQSSSSQLLRWEKWGGEWWIFHMYIVVSDLRLVLTYLQEK